MRELTSRQRTVLFVLCNRGPMSAQGIEDQYLGIYRDTARSVFYSLAKRGLVDVAGFESSRRGREQRTYGLTHKGMELALTLSGDEDENERELVDGTC